MFEKITDALGGALGRRRTLSWRRRTPSSTGSVRQPSGGASDDQIVFLPLNPVAPEPEPAASEEAALPVASDTHREEGNPPLPDTHCVCPVTREALLAGMKIYQCRNCGVSYSEAGWEFLVKFDRGRCCSCHESKAVFLLGKPSHDVEG